jgi:glutaredoxin
MKILQVNKFYKIRNPNELIYFYLPSCPPCKEFNNFLSENMNSFVYEDITILKYSIDDIQNYQEFLKLGGKTVPILVNNNNELLTVEQFKEEVKKQKLILSFECDF